MPDYPLNAQDPLSKLVREHGIETWQALLDHVHLLPYGRNSNRSDFALVLKEQRGTCSSKHAFLKQMAINNNIPAVSLMLGMYKMNESNTPKIGGSLKKSKLAFIPEAHCYLKINGIRCDYTFANSTSSKVFEDLIEEIEIQPNQVDNFKVKWHQDFIKNWVITSELGFSFDEIWKWREDCIAHISKMNDQ